MAARNYTICRPNEYGISDNNLWVSSGLGAKVLIARLHAIPHPICYGVCYLWSCGCTT